MDTTTLTLKLRYEGNEADNNRLRLYDGTQSIHGFARSIQIVTHAFINNEIGKTAPSAKGAKFYMLPSRSGSYIEFIEIIIQNEYVKDLAKSLISSTAYDFIKYAFKKAAGYDAKPESKYVTRVATEDEPFFDELSATIEGPLGDAHRTIRDDNDSITLSRPRGSLVRFDQSTKEWVETREISSEIEKISGNVTRYNVISGNGRLHDDSTNRVIPFRPIDDLDSTSRLNLSWSLDRSNNRLGATLIFDVRRVISASGSTKRYILHDCKRPDQLVPGINPPAS